VERRAFVGSLLAAPLVGAAPKNIVLVSGDEEYRSEEMLPQLARILSQRHGFRCTVLYALDPDGTINPDRRDNTPGLEALGSADLLVLHTRMRDLPDSQMKHLADYIEPGRPIVGLRTATHAFELKTSETYARYNWNRPNGGFGRVVLGETWIRHHGTHAVESTRGVWNAEQARHAILRGVGSGEVWSSTDVYAVSQPLPADCRPLIQGLVLTGMNPGDPAVEGPRNDPPMPILWTKSYKGARVVATTLGTARDLLVRRIGGCS